MTKIYQLKRHPVDGHLIIVSSNITKETNKTLKTVNGISSNIIKKTDVGRVYFTSKEELISFRKKQLKEELASAYKKLNRCINNLNEFYSAFSSEQD